MLKALIEAGGDRVLGFTAFGVEAGGVMAAVQVAMAAGLPYTALRDAVLTHPKRVVAVQFHWERRQALHQVLGSGRRVF